MEFKKSRLDLEGGGGSMPPETNSSTPSPAQSPFKSSGGGGGGPYRGRYTRSSLGGGGLATANTSSGGSSSRFSPYATSRDRPPRRSIPVIRAQREDVRSSGGVGGGFNSSFFGSTSSTAQKIMDTLASMSTPVLNAGRVRVDSIKTVRPIGLIGSSSPLNTSGTFLSATNKFSGPPKTLSPLLIPLTASGVRPDSDKSMWSSKCLSIPPKMVDCGTSTDGLFQSDEKIKPSMGMSPNNNISSQRSNNSTIIATTTHVKNHGGSLKLSDLLAKSRPVNGEYKFDKPLSLGDIDKYLGSDKYKKDLDKSNSSTSDGSDDDDDDANENEDSNMSNHKIPNGDIKSSRTSASTESKIKPETKQFAQWSASSNQWECQVCMVFNNPSDTKCVCCETPNPKAKSDIIVSKWSCPTCMVSNEATAATCVCCTEKNPNFVGDSKSQDLSSSSQPPVTTSTFKFGFGTTSSTTSAVTPATTGFAFGTTSPTKTTLDNAKSASGGFTFGFNKTATLTTTSKPNTTEAQNNNKIDSTAGKNNTFTFGAPPTSLSNSSSSSGSNFKFGVSASDEENLLSKPKPIEFWQCLVCPAQNGMKIFTCVTCGSPRPREFDIGYVKPDNKITADTKFQPVFGRKSAQQDVTSSPPQTSTFSTSSIISPAVTSSSSTTFGNSSFGSFGAGATGNPFGGGSTGSFQLSSVASSGSGGFGTTTTTTSSATTSFSTSTGHNSSSSRGDVTQTQVDGGNNTALTSAAGSGITVPSFQFGSPKRKHDEPEGPADSAKKALPSFQFGSSSTNPPALKLKEPVVAPSLPISVSSPTPQSAANPAGFLEALKNASAAVKASNEKQPSTTLTQPVGGGGSLTTKPFQFGANPSSNPSTSANTSTFGASTTANSFNFGIGGGSNAPNTFGSIPTQQSAGFTPNPPINNQFNLTPNFNFGATAPSSTFTFGAASNPSNSFSFGGTPANSNAPNDGPPPLFQFQSNPSTGGDITGRRIIKKATRRFR